MSTRDKYFYGTGDNDRDFVSKYLDTPIKANNVFDQYLMQKPFGDASSTVPEGFDTCIGIEREIPEPQIEMKYDMITKYKIPLRVKEELQAEMDKINLDIEALKAEMRMAEEQKAKKIQEAEKEEQPFHFNPEDLDV